MSFDPSQIAQVCHEANRGVQRIFGEQVNFPWEVTTKSLRDSVVDGVVAILSGKVTTPEESHANWLLFKQEQGWTWGPVKDFLKKEHPDMVSYDALPAGQHVKDKIFFAIVRAMSEA